LIGKIPADMKHDDLALKTMSFGVKKHEPPSQGFPENTTGLPRRNTTRSLNKAKLEKKTQLSFVS
ncbi:MAG TPA: hypothetical protein VE954_02805, partial [Oligoflexus sp.]|uniref:hypothetical protein n=1 Tax=Oligoflexus sp. TaxID=1971216 RepID=UPI002D614743